ncbi:serine hydrolase domain-containing protein [Polaromonas sp. LjRoot131]|uniref:serine hydrolase domain-containing protein n=1 Tax=Polaromonas sp. LjRoot131 TaxID=3342262 RepID=UPI003ECD1F45
MKHITLPLLLVLALAAGASKAEPDEELLGKAQAYPLGNASTWYSNPYRVGSWSAMDKVPGVKVRVVARPAEASPLPRAASPASISYRYKGMGYALTDFLEHQRTTGLLVLKNGEIVAEHYRYGRKDDARFLSFSMAKSVTSLLLGKALSLGLIASLDDPAEQYAKELAGTPYGATTIRQLLRMSSGLTFTELYDGKDDLSRLSRAAAGAAGAGKPIDVLKSITDRHSPPGEKFVYASSETDVLGRVLAGAAGKNMSELTTEWLWKPMGAEHDAFWRVGIDGQEQANGGFNAILRDWARLGQLLANDGRAIDKATGKPGATQVLPLDYLLDATDPARQPEAFKPRKATPYFGYGYQFWLMPFRERTFAMQGIHGQTLYVQPSTGIVMVMTSVWEKASGKQDVQPYEERDALWRGVLLTLGGSTVQ